MPTPHWVFFIKCAPANRSHEEGRHHSPRPEGPWSIRKREARSAKRYSTQRAMTQVILSGPPDSLAAEIS